MGMWHRVDHMAPLPNLQWTSHLALTAIGTVPHLLLSQYPFLLSAHLSFHSVYSIVESCLESLCHGLLCLMYSSCGINTIPSSLSCFAHTLVSESYPFLFRGLLSFSIIYICNLLVYSSHSWKAQISWRLFPDISPRLRLVWHTAGTPKIWDEWTNDNYASKSISPARRLKQASWCPCEFIYDVSVCWTGFKENGRSLLLGQLGYLLLECKPPHW